MRITKSRPEVRDVLYAGRRLIFLILTSINKPAPKRHMVAGSGTAFGERSAGEPSQGTETSGTNTEDSGW